MVAYQVGLKFFGPCGPSPHKHWCYDHKISHNPLQTPHEHCQLSRKLHDGGGQLIQGQINGGRDFGSSGDVNRSYDDCSLFSEPLYELSYDYLDDDRNKSLHSLTA